MACQGRDASVKEGEPIMFGVERMVARRRKSVKLQQCIAGRGLGRGMSMARGFDRAVAVNSVYA